MSGQAADATGWFDWAAIVLFAAVVGVAVLGFVEYARLIKRVGVPDRESYRGDEPQKQSEDDEAEDCGSRPAATSDQEGEYEQREHGEAGDHPNCVHQERPVHGRSSGISCADLGLEEQYDQENGRDLRQCRCKFNGYDHLNTPSIEAVYEPIVGEVSGAGAVPSVHAPDAHSEAVAS